MNRIESQAVLAGLLLKRVRDDKYPSSTDMDLIEQTIPPQLPKEKPRMQQNRRQYYRGSDFKIV